MLLNTMTDSAEPITMGLGKSTQYQISTNGKAFKIMSDTLYQNKIGSLVREVSCNAVDSHSEAGKGEVPFEVHLPDMMEPWFSIRDFGLGMSDESVRINYCTLFLSTKDNSNDAIGAFGLGSKTPYAYTDSFTITSIYNGERRVYIAAMGADGTPTVTEMAFNETDECNGVEVKIGVDASDFYRFSSELLSQLKFFKVKPTIFNGRNVEFSVLPKVFNTLGKIDILVNDSDMVTHVIQGGVGYPLDFAQITDSLTSEEVKWSRSLVNRGCFLNFEIGEIEVTPSREGISYKYQTIQNIANAFKDAYGMFSDKVTGELAALSSDWERVKYINDGGQMVVDVVKKLGLYPRITLLHNRCVFNVSSLLDTRTIKTFNPDGTLLNEFDETFFKYGITRYEMPTSRMKKVTYQKDSVFDCGANVIFVYDDMPKSSQARLRYYLGENPAVSYLFLVRHHKDSATDADIQNVIDALDGVQVVRLSALDVPPRNYAGSRAGGVQAKSRNYAGSRAGGVQAKYWVLTSDASNTSELEPIYDSIKDADGGYYVVVNSGGDINLGYQTWELCERLNLDKEIYVVRPRNMAYIEKSPEWIPLSTVIAEKRLEENAKDHKVDNMILGVVAALNNHSFDNKMNDFLKTVKIDDPLLRDVLKFYNRRNVSRNHLAFYEMVMDADNRALVTDYTRAMRGRIAAACDACAKKYPLVYQMFNSHYFNVITETEDHIKIYMEAVNKQ